MITNENSDANRLSPAEYGAMGQGKKSESGKVASARNSLKHGLSSRAFCVLPNESKEMYEVQLQQYRDTFQPRDAFEYELVTQMVENVWLIMRSRDLETHAIRVEVHRQRLAHEQRNEPYEEGTLVWLATETLTQRNATFANLHRYRAHNERALLRCHKSLSAHRKDRADIPPPPFEVPQQIALSHFEDPESAPKIENYKTKPPEGLDLPKDSKETQRKGDQALPPDPQVPDSDPAPHPGSPI